MFDLMKVKVGQSTSLIWLIWYHHSQYQSNEMNGDIEQVKNLETLNRGVHKKSLHLMFEGKNGTNTSLIRLIPSFSVSI